MGKPILTGSCWTVKGTKDVKELTEQTCAANETDAQANLSLIVQADVPTYQDNVHEGPVVK